MSATPNLGLPYIDAGQAQKHVTHNEALRYLDTFVQLAVLDRDLTAPPPSPAEGQRWIVKTGASDAWSGHTDHIAAWQDGAWQFSAPVAGWVAYVIDEEILVAWDGSAWTEVSAGSGGGDPAELQDMTLLGIGTTADAANPVSAKLNNVLWAARTVAEGGDGTLRYKLSKESAAKTLSFLLQDNFSGCAEIGLIGDDDFHFKVSPDGTSWLEAIKIDRATGKLSFPVSGGPREMLTVNRAYYVRTDGSDSNNGLANTSGGAFLTLQKAFDVIWGTLDLGGFAVTIQAADGTYTSGILVSGALVGKGTVSLLGNATAPANVFINVTGADAFNFQGGARVSLAGFKLASSSGNGIYAGDSGTVVQITGNMDFGTCGSRHMRVANFAQMFYSGSAYTISGDAPWHITAGVGGVWQSTSARTITASGTRNFSSSFVDAGELGVIRDSAATFSGTFTGKRWNVASNGIINLFGGTANSYYPGNSNGTSTTGGQTI